LRGVNLEVRRGEVAVVIGENCAPLLADGVLCTTGGCPSASFCNVVCTPRKAEGRACASFSECRAGLACTSGTCVPAVLATAKLCSGDYN
jgi:hypothetical protein